MPVDKKLSDWLDGVADKAVESLEEARESTPKEYEDGTYVGVFVQHEFKQSSAGNPGVATKLMFLESSFPEYVGETRFSWRGLDKEDGFKYFGWDLASCGVPLTDPADIVKELRKNPEDLFNFVADKKVIKFQLKTTKGKNGNDYQNMVVKKVIDDFDFSGVTLPDENGEGGNVSGGSDVSGEEADDDTARVGMRVKFNFTYQHPKKKTEITEEYEGIIKEVKDSSIVVTVTDGSESEDYEVLPDDVVEIIKEEAVA